MKTKQCADKKGRGCKKFFPADDKHFGSYSRYNDMGVKGKMLYTLCKQCKSEQDRIRTAREQANGKGNRNKKELMFAGYDSAEEKEFLSRSNPVETQVQWFSFYVSGKGKRYVAA